MIPLTFSFSGIKVFEKNIFRNCSLNILILLKHIDKLQKFLIISKESARNFQKLEFILPSNDLSLIWFELAQWF